MVTPNDEKTIGRYQFIGWGAHYSNYPCSYLTAAAAIGATRRDVDLFLKRLEKNFKDFLIKEPARRNLQVETTLLGKEVDTEKEKDAVRPVETVFPHNEPPSLSTQKRGGEMPRALVKPHSPLRVSNSLGETANADNEDLANTPWPKHGIKTADGQYYSADDSEIPTRRNLWFRNAEDIPKKSHSTSSVNASGTTVRDERLQQVILNKKDIPADELSFLIDL